MNPFFLSSMYDTTPKARAPQTSGPPESPWKAERNSLKINANFHVSFHKWWHYFVHVLFLQQMFFCFGHYSPRQVCCFPVCREHVFPCMYHWKWLSHWPLLALWSHIVCVYLRVPTHTQGSGLIAGHSPWAELRAGRGWWTLPFFPAGGHWDIWGQVKFSCQH